MKIIVKPTASLAAHAVAEYILRSVVSRPDICLGLATGNTMLAVYEHLSRYQAIDWSNVTTFNLDEYVGLKPDDPASYHNYMRSAFFSKLISQPKEHHIPRGDASNPNEEACRYDALLSTTGGIDLQLLGIGRNGHIGFNEPGSKFDSRTRVVTLAESTRIDNAQFFPPGALIPKHAITMGIANITEAHECVLLACGSAKAKAVSQLVNGKKTTNWPATSLLDHQSLRLYLDLEAAEAL